MSSENPIDICVVGFGAIGTLYGWLLSRSGKARISAVCRSNYDTLKEYGVDVESALYGEEKSWRPYRVLKTTEEAADRDYDFVVGCFKTIPDVATTPEILGPLLSRAKTFVLIQNGIGIERDLQAAVPSASVLSACAWIDCTLINNYRVLRHGDLDRLVVGFHEPLAQSYAQGGDVAKVAMKDAGNKALETFVHLLQSGGGAPTAAVSIVAERWRKNLWNSAFSTLATLSRADLFEIYEKSAWEINEPVAAGLMNEVIQVARAIGITEDLLPSTAPRDTIAFAQGSYSDSSKGKPFKPSMLVDLEAGRPMEVEGIIGAVVKQAKEVGVPVPRLETAYAALRLLQRRLIAARA